MTIIIRTTSKVNIKLWKSCKDINTYTGYKTSRISKKFNIHSTKQISTKENQFISMRKQQEWPENPSNVCTSLEREMKQEATNLVPPSPA